MSDVLQHVEAGVMTLTLNRVDKKNSFTAAMYAALADALTQAATDPAVRVVVFQAPGSRSDGGLAEDESFDHTAPLTVLINPVIEVVNPATEGGWEGCLSVPDLRGWVERARHIRYTGYDTEGRRIVREAKGFHARVVQHECDHLEGMLYPQRMKDLTKLIFESEIQHWLTKQKEDAAQ